MNLICFAAGLIVGMLLTMAVVVRTEPQFPELDLWDYR